MFCEMAQLQGILTVVVVVKMNRVIQNYEIEYSCIINYVKGTALIVVICCVSC